MTRYFVDTEFIDEGKTIALISIGIVAEDGRELYLQSCEFDHRKASVWVRAHVFPHLLICPWVPDTNHLGIRIPRTYHVDRPYHKHQGGQCVDQIRGLIHNCPWRTRAQIREEVRRFIDTDDDKVELWAWCGCYDYIALCQLFGTMMDIPDGWPHYIHEFQQILDDRGIADDELPPQEDGLHNALADAHHLKKLWGYIVRNDAWQ